MVNPDGLCDRWIEIDVDAVRNNLQQVKSKLDEEVRLIAVLKADAYGHGAIEVARILYQNGVDFFAVSFLEEALRLRQAGIRASIMLFTPLATANQMEEALKNYLTISVTSQWDADLLEQVSNKLNITATIHLKIDTGLGRFGLTGPEAVEICRQFQNNSRIYIEGIYTHMAQAASNSRYTKQQFNRFMEVVTFLEEAGYRIPVKHCANSAVFLKYPRMHLNAVRIGTLLSGQHPVGDFANPLLLKDPYCFKSRIISVRTLPAGSYIGYYSTYRLKKKAQIAVIPVGYQHGLNVEVMNRPASFKDFLKIVAKTILTYLNISRFQPGVYLHGHKYPIRGKVFMQLALVEIPWGVPVEVGEVVEVPVRKTLAGGDVVRLYVREGEAGKIRSESSTSYIIEEDN